MVARTSPQALPAAQIDMAAFRHLYPFESHWLQLKDGLRYHYLDEGPQNAPVVLMLHGNPTWSFYYRNLALLLRENYRVIVPDHIGCGLSDKPQAYAYQLNQHIDNLTQLIDHLSLKNITLVVHDWGGAIGMGYATQAPQNIAGVVVFNTAAFFVARIPKRIAVCRVPWLGEALVQGMNGFVLGSLVFATTQHHRFSRAVRAGYTAPYHSWQTRIATHRFIKDIPMDASHPTRQTLNHIEARLSQLKDTPMLILWGERDFCFTPQDFLPEWTALFPQAQVHRFPYAGHFVLEDAIDEIFPKVRAFLE